MRLSSRGIVLTSLAPLGERRNIYDTSPSDDFFPIAIMMRIEKYNGCCDNCSSILLKRSLLSIVFTIGTEMQHINKKNNSFAIAVATLLTFIIMAAVSNITTTPAATATTTTTTSNTTMPSSSGIVLSSQPIYQESTPPGNVIPINQTHIGATHTGNGTLTLPDSNQTINTTSNGTAIASLATPSAIAKTTIRAPNGETATITIYEIIQFNNPTEAPLGGGKGIKIIIFHTNSTGMLAPLDGVIAAAINIIQPNGESELTAWRWESGIPLPTTGTPSNTTMDESSPLSPMNTTTTTTTANATTAASDTNTTGTASEEQGEGEQQQCQLELMTNEETFGLGDSVTLTVTNGGDEDLEFSNSILGLEIENQDTGEAYPLFSAQAIITLEPGESRTSELSYEVLVSEIGTGIIKASVSSDEGCLASTTFTLA